MGRESNERNWRLEGTRPTPARPPELSHGSTKSLFFSYLAPISAHWQRCFSLGLSARYTGMTYLARTQNLHRMIRWVLRANQERRHRCFVAASKAMLSPCERL